TNTASIIFSNNGASQTANLSRTNEGWYKSGTWYASQPAGKDEITEGTVDEEKLVLFQNYPNPFNPTSTIGYYLPESDHVRLEVYDMLGRLVRTLINETIEKGYHTVEFQASDLPSGVYVYQLHSSTGVQIRKMTLMK
ncbi:MAG: T9SS type A sorting domain-containing protein, partial [Bacteroidetes bacterium]|nr:T9SS type A sorting domain-containing protein [Bacteroidota bacterium]